MMNDKFYRKKKPGTGRLSKSLRPLLVRGRIIKLLVAGTIAVFVLFGNRGVVQRVHFQLEKTRLEDRIQIARDDSVYLREQLNRIVHDDEFIEKIARERYGMIRSGEQVYRIIEE